MMILQGVGHPVPYLGVWYANDPKKGGYMAYAPALDLTTLFEVILCRLAANSHKPRIGHIFGYMAQNAIPRAPNPLATPHFLWFPPLRIA